jgi:redox-sensitive bicupin YhaK (pirin superfamily)
VLLEGTMGVLASGVPVEFVAARATRLMVLGGEPVGARELWWNFVAPGWDRIEQAKADWAAGRFDKIRGDEEFIPLPDD